MKILNILIICCSFLIIFGCKSAKRISEEEFVFSTETSAYPWRTSVFNSETNTYSYKFSGEKGQLIIPFSKEEKDSLRKISSKNFCQCIKSYDSISKITYIRTHRLNYKFQSPIKTCDTVKANANLPETKEFKFFVKFRSIVTKKPQYQKAFPWEFETL